MAVRSAESRLFEAWNKIGQFPFDKPAPRWQLGQLEEGEFGLQPIL
jgi:hypothetical protein|tara:strand:+ start:179 stop:316 length:138 start_codon:yes stop_codon:yes gene_type:complete